MVAATKHGRTKKLYNPTCKERISGAGGEGGGYFKGGGRGGRGTSRAEGRGDHLLVALVI